MRKRYYRILLAMTAMAFLCNFVFAVENTEDADYVFAKKAFKDGLYDLAGNRFESVLRNYPNTPRIYEIHSLLGRSCYYQNKFTRALYEFDVVLNAPAGSDAQDEALYWSGEIYLKNGDFRKALGFYQRVIDEFPSSRYLSHAIYSKGWCYYRLGLLNDAVVSFKEVVSKYPLDRSAPEAQFRIGECGYLMAEYTAAEKELRKFIEKFPVSGKTAEAYYLMGEVSFYLEKHRDAVACFQRALAITPGAKWAEFAAYRAASSMYRIGDYDGSIKGYKKCLERRENDFLSGAALLGLAQNYEKTGAASAAVKAYNEVIAMRPKGETVPEAYLRKAKLLYSQKKYAEAEDACLEAIKSFPGSRYSEDLHYELGRAYLSEDRADDALREFALIREGSKYPDLAANAASMMGDIYLSGKEYQKAIESYDEILSRYLDSRLADYAQMQIGNIFLVTNKPDQAILAYQSALANFPDTALRENILFSLGTAEFRKGDFDQASLEFKNLLKEFPSGENSAQAMLYLANSLYNSGNYAEAIPVYKNAEKYLKDEKLRAMAAYQIGWAYYGMGKDSPALDEFTRFLKSYPASALAADARFWLAEYNGAKGRYDKAREYYYSIAQDFSSSPGRNQISDGTSDLAERALYQAALTFQDEGKADVAIVRLEELASKFPDSEFTKNGYRKIARLKKDAKSFDGAIGYFRKTLGTENTESNAQLQYEVAECVEGKGDLRGAVEEYLKVPYIYPKGIFWSVRAQLKAAQIFERLGQPGEARKLYEKLSDMDVEESAFARKRLEWLKWQDR
jgi:TolA-binding protein